MGLLSSQSHFWHSIVRGRFRLQLVRLLRLFPSCTDAALPARVRAALIAPSSAPRAGHYMRCRQLCVCHVSGQSCANHTAGGMRFFRTARGWLQVGDLVDLGTGRPQPGRDGLVSKMRWNVLEALQRFCAGPAAATFYCAQVDPGTQLPSGDAFHIAAWAMLLSGYQGSFALSGRVRHPHPQTPRGRGARSLSLHPGVMP